MTYKCVHFLSPSYSSDMSKRCDVHNCATRHCSDLQIPKCRSALVQRSLRSLALRGRGEEGRGNWSEHEGGEGNGERGRGRGEGKPAVKPPKSSFRPQLTN